jgi:SNF2 family DNA or RNA helicase
MATVELHAQGLRVAPEAGDRPSVLGRRLRAQLGSGQVRSFGGWFLVPRSEAGLLAETFGPEEASWEPEALAVAAEQARRHYAVGMSQKVLLGGTTATAEVATAIKGLQRDLDPHQLEAVAAMTVEALPGFALFDEQGVGKTTTALASFHTLRRRGTVQRLLVVVPKSVVGAWTQDAAALLGAGSRVVVASGPATERRRLIASHYDILIVTYDAAVRDRVWLEMTLAASPGNTMLVLDESYMVKNAATTRARALASLRPLCERAVVLCGTPAPNSAGDVVNQVNLADGGIAFGGLAIPREEAEARTAIRGRLPRAPVLRRLKSNVLPDLPGKNFERLIVPLQPEQRARYDRACDDRIVAVRGLDESQFRRHLASFLAQRAALLQLCSHPGVFDAGYTEVPAKFLALDALLRALLEASRKVVLWSFYRFTLAALEERFASYGLVRIDGSVVSPAARSRAVERFQTDPDTRIFLGNPAAAGAGITLTAAHHAVFESFSNQVAHYLQSLDRVHRRGQHYPVTYHVLLAHDTLETAEFDRLVSKEQAGHDLLGDEYDAPPTRERFLLELGLTP